MNKRNSGFTLVELMVVVAIVGIITSIAYPNYKNSVKKTRRADAEATLMGFANAMERFFTENNTYKGACGTTSSPQDTGTSRIFPAKSPLTGSTKFYNLTINAATDTTYTLRATPISTAATGDSTAQNGDGILEVTNTGEKHWDKNNDGSIGTDEKTW